VEACDKIDGVPRITPAPLFLLLAALSTGGAVRPLSRQDIDYQALYGQGITFADFLEKARARRDEWRWRYNDAGYSGYQSTVQELLLNGHDERGRARDQTRAAIGHALAFPTWHSLTREQGLTDGQAIELMSRLLH